MRATSLHQPYASLVAHGLKGVETRGPRSPRAYRGPLLIHAAKCWDTEQADTVMRLCMHGPVLTALGGCASMLPRYPWIETAAPLPLGAFVAVARVADIRLMTPEWIAEQTPLERAVGGWEPGRYGWVLEDVRALPAPVPCVGAQGLWEVRRVQAAGVAAYPKRLARELPEADYDRLRAIYDEVGRGR